MTGKQKTFRGRRLLFHRFSTDERGEKWVNIKTLSRSGNEMVWHLKADDVKDELV
ncbi:MAG: hypothetical protein KGL39_32820 [Patescibacteria group bacterium]|nr:hypothetical protein [Patescibacteria group bacterium]